MKMFANKKIRKEVENASIELAIDIVLETVKGVINSDSFKKMSEEYQNGFTDMGCLLIEILLQMKDGEVNGKCGS